MTAYISNRDGGLTDEQGHFRFQNNVWDGNVIGDGLQVTQSSPLAMSVDVNDGDIKIDYSDYGYTGWVDGAETVTITTADPTNPRIDRIVAYVDRGESPQQVNPNNPGLMKFLAVAGTPGAVPSRPSDGAVDTAVGAGNPWADLADVLVNNGVTQITDANITDTRQGVRMAATNFAVGTIDVSTSGVKTVSGLPFRPRYVEFKLVLMDNETLTGLCDGYLDDNVRWSRSISSRSSSHITRYDTNREIAFVTLDAALSPLARVRTNIGAPGTINDDGFTITLSEGGQAHCQYIARA